MNIDEVIEVVPFDDRWHAGYENEKSRLIRIFGETALEIQHFGSTSVPGMFAKPIIDVLIGVKTLELSPVTITRLEALGYQGFGEAGVPGRLYFAKRRGQAYNLAVVIWNGEQWVNNILIRDYLRNNPEAARRYSDCKQRTIRKGMTTLLAYSDDKAAFVLQLLELAKQDQRIQE